MVKKITCFILFLSVFYSCSKEVPIPLESVYNITALGDSRVEGGPFPAFESYRYYLWQRLIDRGILFDFVGTRNDTKTYPEYNGEQFDPNHEGSLGDRTDQVLGRLNVIIDLSPEMIGDVILLGVGGNDLYQGISGADAATNISAIVDALQAHNSSITIFIEQIEDGTSQFNSTGVIDAAELDALNNAIFGIATDKTTSTSKVVAVNMVNLLDDDDYADDLHYNASGAVKIANQYFIAMENDLF